MLGRGIKLARIFGIEIWFDYSWLLIFALVAWSLASGFFPKEYPGLTPFNYWFMGTVSSILLFICVLLHELSHSFVAQKSGISVPKITLFIFGGVAQISKEPKNAKTEFNIAVAGPICSFMLALFFWILSTSDILYGNKLTLPIIKYLAFINIALAIFNLFPGFPLDGGRILRAYLWDRWGDVKRATHTVSQIGSGFGIALVFFGVVNLFWGNIIGGIWFVFIGFFLNQAAKSGLQISILRDMLKGTKVRDVMTSNVVSVYLTTNINNLVRDYFHHHLFVSFPVINENGALLGMISLKQVKAVPQDKWEQTKVEDIMIKPDGYKSLSPNDEIFDAFNLIMESELGRVPVVEGKKLVGIITKRDIMTLLTIKTDLGA